ncbi:Levanase precursor [compost metagenome]
MTLPRELYLESREGNILLVQKPAKELEAARIPVLSLKDVTVQEINASLAGLQLDAYEIAAKLPRGMSAGFKVRVGTGEETVTGIDAQTGELYVDRAASGQAGFHEHFPGRHSAALQAPGETNDLCIFVDRTSVEVFGNGGQAVITDLIFPKSESAGLAVFAENEEIPFLSLDIYKLVRPAANGDNNQQSED